MSDKTKKTETENDKLADELVVLLTDSISRALGMTGLDPSDARVHRSLLRAIGGSMAVMALSAEVAGVKPEESKKFILDNFTLKFDYGVKMSALRAIRATKGPPS